MVAGEQQAGEQQAGDRQPGEQRPGEQRPGEQQEDERREDERLRRVLGAPELDWLAGRIRDRLAHGAALDGTMTLTGATPAQRQAAARLLGRPPGRGTSLSVPLPAVEEALRSAGLAPDLRTAVEALTGVVPDLAAGRARQAERRAAARRAAAACRHSGTPWHAAWLEEICTDGTVTRLLGAGRDQVMAQSAAVLDLLPASDLPLPVLAERATGDTKALSGPPLSGLILRALAHWQGLAAVPGTREARRPLWEAAGVIVDDLASQVLVLNVPASGSPLADWLTEAASLGVPFRITLHQLVSMPVTLGIAQLRVCENPAVLRAAAAELGARSAPLVCSEGIPSAACHRLLHQARRLFWRGDFDWTGLRTTAAAMDRYGAVPWRMSAADYRAALAEGDSEPLRGTPAAAPWDEQLAAEMRAAGRAVMEERLIPVLLSDLANV